MNEINILNNQIVLKPWIMLLNCDYFYREAYSKDKVIIGDIGIYYSEYSKSCSMKNSTPWYLNPEIKLLKDFAAQLQNTCNNEVLSNKCYEINELLLIQNLVDSYIIRLNETYLFS